MSCYLVSEEHLRVVSAAIAAPSYLTWMWKGKERKAASHTEIARMLRKENLRSWCARYADEHKELPRLLREASKLDVFDGGVATKSGQDNTQWIVESDSKEVTCVSVQRRGMEQRTYTSIQCMKLVQCVMYNCNEHSTWQTSEAYAMCSSALLYYTKSAVYNGMSDTYDAAKWSI